jgi:hypothetical protein
VSFLLYTNVISEWVEPQPDPHNDRVAGGGSARPF